MDANRPDAFTTGDAAFTDLYELTMLQSYFDHGMVENATFDLFVRALPPTRNYLVAAGLEQVLEYLEALHFKAESLRYLDSLGLFTAPFLDHLASFRFTGDVDAAPEGTVVFPGEPILQVTAPVGQAQLVETYLLNQVTFQTAIASKGARAVTAARGRTLVDFGSRRAHGTDAALKAARALYLAGYDSTSNVLAGRLYGIPVAGTMAHSYVQAHDSEADAFEAFLKSYPATALLVDTYDTDRGIERAIDAAKRTPGADLRTLRLDSGDLASLAIRAREMLNAAGLTDVQVFASGGLDEAEIASLVSAGAPIDGFGVGTAAVVSDDAPSLESVYKLVEYAGTPRIKLSTAKATLPGRKQVYRTYKDGVMAGDVIALANEGLAGEPLLQPVTRAGKRTTAGDATLDDARRVAAGQLARLPETLRGLETDASAYPVGWSPGIDAEIERLLQVHGHAS